MMQMQALMQEIKNVTLLVLLFVLAFHQHELEQSKHELRYKMNHAHQPCCMYMYGYSNMHANLNDCIYIRLLYIFD